MDYEILDHIREVPMSAFQDDGKPSFYSQTEKAKVEALAEEIKASGRIEPLIVVVDHDLRGPYVLEGGHRFDALKLLGAKSFPALIVADTQLPHTGKMAKALSPSDRTAYDKETAAIHTSAKTPEAQQPHKFQAAEWTHPNGHPRCVVCGQEERTGGICEGILKYSPEQERDDRGRFGSGSSRGDLANQFKPVPSEQRVWNGQVVSLKQTPTKAETGVLGEHIAQQYLESQGLAVRSLNTQGNNFPVDLIAGNQVIEVKAGLASNLPDSQKWRATIGQPGPKETAWLARASDKAKFAWNEKKREAILQRKKDAVRAVGKRLGRAVVGYTVGMIINHDTKTADVYKFKGFHLSIPWKSAQAEGGYVGTFRYRA